MRFSPLEESILSLLSGRWVSAEELQRELFPEFRPEAVGCAIDFLQRLRLVQPLERRHGTPLYERTELGNQLLSKQLRDRMAGELRVA